MCVGSRVSMIIVTSLHRQHKHNATHNNQQHNNNHQQQHNHQHHQQHQATYQRRHPVASFAINRLSVGGDEKHTQSSSIGQRYTQRCSETKQHSWCQTYPRHATV